jgi:hypothetical protein
MIIGMIILYYAPGKRRRTYFIGPDLHTVGGRKIVVRVSDVGIAKAATCFPGQLRSRVTITIALSLSALESLHVLVTKMTHQNCFSKYPCSSGSDSTTAYIQQASRRKAAQRCLSHLVA